MSALNVKEVPSYKKVDLGNIIINENATGFTIFKKDATIDDRITENKTTIVYNPGDRIGIYKMTMGETDYDIVLQAEVTVVETTTIGLKKYKDVDNKIHFEDICFEVGNDIMQFPVTDSFSRVDGCILTNKLLDKLCEYSNKSFTAGIILDLMKPLYLKDNIITFTTEKYDNRSGTTSRLGQEITMYRASKILANTN